MKTNTLTKPTTQETTEYYTLQEALDKLDYKNAKSIFDGFSFLSPAEINEIVKFLDHKFQTTKRFWIFNNLIHLGQTPFYKVIKKDNI